MGRHLDKYPDFLQPLYDVLVDYRGAQCQDPRDKVFGLLGLILPEERDFLGRYFPDYAMSEDHVRIITLAHLMQFHGLSQVSEMERRREISADSEEVFTGLGVSAKTQRRRLLERAGKLDYLAEMSTPELLFWLRYEDEMEECEGIVQEERVAESSRSCGRKWMKKSMGIISTVVVVWLIMKGAQMSKLHFEKVGNA